ncbi:carbonic anhydrase [Pseudanabaena sp. PCC 6802]|uniref:carbonic anhydrase n=1 Tax=Pseudanabaena sp. PCC 6802 TaxID=118173 RepID=UPI0012EA08BD|nr:carbonic anhydrase [Pseudanabaena sp. PCC 6802]
MERIHGMLGRRSLMQIAVAGGLGVAIDALNSVSGSIPPAYAGETETIGPDAALKKLLEGNQRFMQQKREYPHQAQQRLQEVAQAQHPVVTVLSCADSRVPPELIFDQGIGDLFDVRIAGNIVTPESLGSVEYAAALLHTPLVLVLGHERCGAVTAAVQNGTLPGQIGTFVRAIAPAIARIKKESLDPVEDLVVANVRYQVEKLRQDSPLLVDLEKSGKLKIVGGRYDLDTGKVTLVT